MLSRLKSNSNSRSYQSSEANIENGGEVLKHLIVDTPRLVSCETPRGLALGASFGYSECFTSWKLLLLHCSSETTPDMLFDAILGAGDIVPLK